MFKDMANRTLIVNAGQLLTLSGDTGPRSGPAVRNLGVVRGGALLVEDDKIVSAGIREIVQKHDGASEARLVDADGRVVMPGFVDCHTHPVFAQPRLMDFELRTQGKTYHEIARDGGGILSTVQRVRGATVEDLVRNLRRWTEKFLECGTTTLEAKSGYGLDVENELKMLRAIRQVDEEGPAEILPTFMGAHAVPAEFRDRPERYVEVVVKEMIPEVAKSGLARFVDAFCETGYFSAGDTQRILEAGLVAGLKPRVHADQITYTGGARVAAAVGAASADHLDCTSAEDFGILKSSGVVATLLPASNFFMGFKTYPKAREIMDAGVPVALATDFNPGTCPCWNMQMVVSVACCQMRMTVEEALTASTLNAACALGLGDRIGSLEAGKQADVLILDVEDYREIPYHFGVNHVRWVMKKGRVVHSNLLPFP